MEGGTACFAGSRNKFPAAGERCEFGKTSSTGHASSDTMDYGFICKLNTEKHQQRRTSRRSRACRGRNKNYVESFLEPQSVGTYKILERKKKHCEE